MSKHFRWTTHNSAAGWFCRWSGTEVSERLARGDDKRCPFDCPGSTIEPFEKDDPNLKTYTVIGAWIADRPVPVGVVEGHQQVTGGDVEEFPQGVWATSVSAEDDESAQAYAVGEMTGGEDQDNEEWVARLRLGGEAAPDRHAYADANR